MKTISQIRGLQPNVLCIGSHPDIIQSMLDYDFLIKRQSPSVKFIITKGRKAERFFWGESEIIIPVYESIEAMKPEQRKSITFVLNVQSARRVLSSTINACELLPSLEVLTIFAEQTPESHSLRLKEIAAEKDILIVGPSSVGLLIPGAVKLGAIGGTQHKQLVSAKITSSGNVAVISTSGGMVNEIIHNVTATGLGVSFAMAVGGDVFPATSPSDAMLMAEADKQTDTIVYFGELGGRDEYEIADFIQKKRITKKIIAYVAGTVAELFETPPQFGHAKALAKNKDESARTKRNILKDAGVMVCDTFADLGKFLLEDSKLIKNIVVDAPSIGSRRKALIISHLSGERNGDTYILGNELIKTVDNHNVASLVVSILLGENVTSKKVIDFVDFSLRLLSDHGPYVSGAVNTIVASRAGKDLVSSLASGLLTIGNRFGGAINASAGNWLNAVNTSVIPSDFIANFSQYNGIIPGIGHKKYRIDMPDPRVEALMRFTGNTNKDRYLKYARNIEALTTVKKANLILNVDGAIGAILLDILESELGYDYGQLNELVEIEFFNALFVISRTIGLTGHYLDQRRNDEGLLRLGSDDVRYLG